MMVIISKTAPLTGPRLGLPDTYPSPQIELDNQIWARSGTSTPLGKTHLSIPVKAKSINLIHGGKKAPQSD